MSHDLKKAMAWLHNMQWGWHADENCQCPHTDCDMEPCTGKRNDGCEANIPDDADDDYSIDATPCESADCGAAEARAAIATIREAIEERDDLQRRLSSAKAIWQKLKHTVDPDNGCECQVCSICAEMSEVLGE
jgi:hypothetical protein